MKKYNVSVSVVATASVTIEAENEEQALAKAKDEMWETTEHILPESTNYLFDDEDGDLEIEIITN